MLEVFVYWSKNLHEDYIFNYVLPSLDGELHPHEIPSHYKEFKYVFKKKNVNILSKHWPYNYFEEGVQSPFKPIYNLSQDELLTLHEYINKNLENGFIWHSKFPTSAPINFVKKKDGSLWICVDYQGLNRLTIRNR
jgi:hypothetical protein